MEWIYGERRSVTDKKAGSYKINPAYIIAVDLNHRELIVKDFPCPLYYNDHDEDSIIKLISSDKE